MAKKEKCESGCKGPVVAYDREGVPLCAACAQELQNQQFATTISKLYEGYRPGDANWDEGDSQCLEACRSRYPFSPKKPSEPTIHTVHAQDINLADFIPGKIVPVPPPECPPLRVMLKTEEAERILSTAIKEYDRYAIAHCYAGAIVKAMEKQDICLMQNVPIPY